MALGRHADELLETAMHSAAAAINPAAAAAGFGGRAAAAAGFSATAEKCGGGHNINAQVNAAMARLQEQAAPSEVAVQAAKAAQ